MSVVGFDFGNLNCVICQAKRGGIDTVLNENSKRMTTNAVSFQGKERFLGEKAVPLMRSNFKNTFVEVKRFLGKKFSDPQVQKDIARLPNKEFVQELEGDKIGLKFQYNDETLVLSPEDIAAMMLGQLKETAQIGNEGKPVADCVISVPAFYTDVERRALLDAAKIANLNTLRIINDNTATALAYGIWKSARNVFDENEKQYVMFVDVGDSSYQVSIVSFIQGKLEVVATAWDANFGGRDVDDAIVNHFAEEFKSKHSLDPRTNAKSLIKLRGECRKAKTTLTPEGVTMANINAEFLMNDLDFRSKLTIETFNDLVAGFTDRIRVPLEKVLQDSGLTAEQISSVEIVGGGSRPRFVKKIISDTLKLDQSKPNYGLSTTLNADESVARGCALNCAMLSPVFRVKEFEVVDVCAYPIRVSWEQQNVPMNVDEGEETAGENHVILFKSGDKLPMTRRITFVRSEPFELVAEYDESAVELLPPGVNRHLGKYKISGMPTGDFVPRIRVDFHVNIHGVFTIGSCESVQEITETPMEVEEGSEKAEGEEGKAEGEAKAEGEEEEKPKRKFKKDILNVVQDIISLSEGDLKNASDREKSFAAQDKIIRETSEARNAVEEYIYKMRDNVDGELRQFATDEERTKFIEDLTQAENWIYDDGADESKDVYVKKLEDLKVIGDKINGRKYESEMRAEKTKDFSQRLDNLLKVANSTAELYSHIDETERKTVRTECENAQKWLNDALEKIGNQKPCEDPTVTCVEIESKVLAVETVCRPIVTKKKPPPPKEEKKDAEMKDSKDDEPAKEGVNPTPDMELD